MKKILLLTATMIFVASGIFAQNVWQKDAKRKFVGKTTQKTSAVITKATFLSEDFEGGVLPTDWEQVDGDCGWLFGADGSSTYFTIPAHTNYAYVNDDDCNGDMSDVWLITPSIDFTGASGLVLDFATFSENDIFTIKTSIDGGTSWTDLETIGDYAEWTTVSVDLSSVDGQSDVKIAFHYNDDGSWAYGWAIDDVTIYELPTNDLSVSTATPEFILSGNSHTPTVTIANNGSAVQNDFQIDVVINDGTSDVYTSTKTVTGAALASLTSDVYTMDDEWTTPADGNYTVTATVTLTGDENASNDEIVLNCVIMELIAYAGNSTTLNYYGLDYTDGTTYTLNSLSTDPAFPMAEEFDGTNIYRVHDDMTYGTVSLDGTYTNVGTFSGVTGTPTGLAYDFTNGIMYACLLDGSNLPQLCTADLATGVLTLVGSGTEGMIIGMDFANDGMIYGPDLTNDNLYQIDPATGTVTSIGALGVDINFGQDVSFDVEEERLYTITCGAVYELGYYDIATGAFNTIADMDGDQYATLVITKTPGLFPLSVNPVNMATDVAIDAIVSATFSANIFETDFSGITITPDPGNVIASIVDDVLTISHDDFAYNTEYTVTIPTGSINDGSDDLAFDVEWSFTTALDPTLCNDPSDITISDITAFTATVNWTENGPATAWNVAYGSVGFDPDTEGTTVTADATTKILTDLTDDSVYEVYVQAFCDPNVSGWAGPIEFSTLFNCIAINTLPYTTTFDVEEPCWIINQTNVNETWNWDTDEYVCLYDDALGAQDEWLISPEFDLSGVTDNLSVTFNWLASYAYSVDPDDNYDMLLKGSINGTDWTTLWDETEEGVFVDWTEYTTIADASAYAGEASVWFAFNYVGTDGAQWSVLDFSLDVVSDIESNISSNISVYPNPANNVINVVNAENANIVVLNMVGEVVATIDNASSTQTIDISNFANGTYFVRVNDEVIKVNIIK